ncbi:MAG: hypothetical protein VKO39_10880 [Cyanobacteriota bacterium]|nr:hypothetical protein [Cyanobacteriota bacterium]
MKALPSWWRAPGWTPLRRTPPRLPLALTLGTTLLLLVGPALLLRQLPRPQAFGLEKLMASVSLLQSFRANPDRPVPELWRQRLGPELADRLWRAQTRTWWQFWDGSASAQPFLAISSRGTPLASSRGLAVSPLRVGDLVIFSPDPLSQRLLNDRLRLQVRPSPGLRLRCLPRLERDQAVFWRPTALGELLGPLAPFFQDVQEGCLTLTLQSAGLSWSGEAASVEGMLLEAAPNMVDAPAEPPFRPAATDALLELQGTSLERLLAGLLARELIRQPLAERWGIGREQLALLRHTPFRLLLRPLPQGPFQASMELSVRVGGKERQWKDVLRRLAGTLQKEGLRLHSSPPAPPAAPPAPPGGPEVAPAAEKPGGPRAPSASDALGVARGKDAGMSRPPSSAPTNAGPLQPWPLALWAREDGVVVGGWQVRSEAGDNDQISFFLGPQAAQPAPVQVSELPKQGGMRLLARPRELALRGLLPEPLPEVVKRSTWLWWSADPLPGLGPDAPLSQLQGSLSLRP